MREKALTYLDDELRTIYDEWCKYNKNESSPGKFNVLTKYIGKISEADSFGEWVIDHENDGTSENLIHMPFVHYKELVDSFVKEFYQFSSSHREYELTDYLSILERNGLTLASASMYDVDSLDDQCILALMMGAIRADRFSEGTLLSLFQDGSVEKWLKRLKSIDNENDKVEIEEIYFDIGGFSSGHDRYHIIFNQEGQASLRTAKGIAFNEFSVKKQYSREESAQLLDGFKSIKVDYWNNE
ncbi:DUF6508 domain-containing protein [Bacillus sp. FJAT-27916]|uniref:DUF6508 domain-containing protein n=1 Tax=Bacillus sp. FJAT-27916 TaxID=1679169 RepID=UPI000AC0609C|nr:DUF6508 domain-containing protein [Bacillus sp. FJAT-27916]